MTSCLTSRCRSTSCSSCQTLRRCRTGNANRSDNSSKLAEASSPRMKRRSTTRHGKRRRDFGLADVFGCSFGVRSSATCRIPISRSTVRTRCSKDSTARHVLCTALPESPPSRTNPMRNTVAIHPELSRSADGRSLPAAGQNQATGSVCETVRQGPSRLLPIRS